ANAAASAGRSAPAATEKRGPVSHSGVSGLAEARARVARPVSDAALDPHAPRPPGAGALEPARLAHHVAQRLTRHETAAVVQEDLASPIVEVGTVAGGWRSAHVVGHRHDVIQR